VWRQWLPEKAALSQSRQDVPKSHENQGGVGMKRFWRGFCTLMGEKATFDLEDRP
jgi:hypothetical protein